MIYCMKYLVPDSPMLNILVIDALLAGREDLTLNLSMINILIDQLSLMMAVRVLP